MAEYLSISFSIINSECTEGTEVSINGAVAMIGRSRRVTSSDEDGNAYGYTQWSAIEVINNQSIINDKTLIRLFFEANTDVAVLANHFAKDGWTLFKVRNNNQYLLFQR